jgi:hypothetical protein
MYVGVVRYGEKDMRGVNLINFLFTKRKCFEKERELRIVLQPYNGRKRCRVAEGEAVWLAGVS